MASRFFEHFLSTDMTTPNEGKITVTLDVRTIIAIVSVVLGLGAAGYGGIGQLVSKDVPTNESVNEAASTIVGELRQIRREMNSLQALRYQVEDHADMIDSLQRAQKQLNDNQAKGFGVLWEQNKLLLDEIRQSR